MGRQSLLCRLSFPIFSPPSGKSSEMLKKLFCGINHQLEEEANRWLAEARKGVTNHSDKQDYLSEEQLAMRLGREVYNENGVPDKSIISGLYRRAYNPNMGKRPSKLVTYPEEGSRTLYEW